MEQASSSTQLTVINIIELLNKPLLGTLVAVLAGKHDAITPKHGKSQPSYAASAPTGQDSWRPSPPAHHR
jgi:hypothetical protein